MARAAAHPLLPGWEQQGLVRPLRQVDPRWGDSASFRREVQRAYDDIFVARPERRRARGKGNAATIRQVKERDGAPVVYERKSITDLSEKRLDVQTEKSQQFQIVAAELSYHGQIGRETTAKLRKGPKDGPCEDRRGPAPRASRIVHGSPSGVTSPPYHAVRTGC